MKKQRRGLNSLNVLHDRWKSLVCNKSGFQMIFLFFPKYIVGTDVISVACFCVRDLVTFHLMFIILSVRFRLLICHVYGNSYRSVGHLFSLSFV